MNIRICGTGSALPERKITNDDLSQIMDTSDEWISSRTGIKTRHLATEETTTSLAAEAAKKALADADMKPEEVELIIAATVTPDHLVPTLSCEVQREIGAVNAVAFDLGAACSGYDKRMLSTHFFCNFRKFCHRASSYNNILWY